MHILQTLSGSAASFNLLRSVQRDSCRQNNRAGIETLKKSFGGLHDQNGKQYNQISLQHHVPFEKLELAKGLEPPTL